MPENTPENYCLNCGSQDFKRVITQSPSDDLDEYWCNACDLFVNIGPIQGILHLAEIVDDYNQRKMALTSFMKGCGY